MVCDCLHLCFAVYCYAIIAVNSKLSFSSVAFASCGHLYCVVDCLIVNMGHRFATELQQQLQLQLATIQCNKFAFVDARVRRAFRVLLHNAGNFAIVSDERHYFVTRRRCGQSVIQQSMLFASISKSCCTSTSFVCACKWVCWQCHLVVAPVSQCAAMAGR